MAQLSIIFIQLILAIFIYPGISFAQSGKDAVKALKKIEAKVEMGISYQKYREALGDANVELKLFLESPSAKKTQNLASSLSKAMEHYKDAAELWSITIETGRVPYFSPNTKPPVIGAEYTNGLFKKYPKAYDRLREYRSGFGKEIAREDFLSVIWVEASKELKKASSYLQE